MRAFVLLIAVLGLTACQPRTAALPPDFDYGTVIDGRYDNPFFGLTLPLPSGWHLQDKEANQAMMEQGSRALSGDDAELRARIEANYPQTATLLALFKHPVGSAVSFNPNLIVMAENLRAAPLVRSGPAYLGQLRDALQAGQVPVAFPSELESTSLGDAAAHVLPAELTLGPATVQQKYYVNLRQRYALCVILTYHTPEDLHELEQVLASLSLTPDA